MTHFQVTRQQMAVGNSGMQDLLANGHAKVNGTVAKLGKGDQKQENIFLFIPNIIGGFFTVLTGGRSQG